MEAKVLQQKLRGTMKAQPLGNKIAIIFLLYSLCIAPGCTSNPKSLAMRAWRSPDSTPQQSVTAARTLVSVGMSRSEVQKILGPDGIWTHKHGPSVRVHENGSSEHLEDHDYWTLDYQRSSHVIIIYFRRLSGHSDYDNFVVTQIRYGIERKP